MKAEFKTIRIMMVFVISLVLLSGMVFAYQKKDSLTAMKKESTPVLENVIVKNSGTDEDKIDNPPFLNAVAFDSIDSVSGENNANPKPAKWITDLIGYKKIEARILNVPADYEKIQDAISSANRGDVVKVAEGEYRENIIMKNGVSLEGAGADKTMLDGNNLGNVIVFKNVRDPRTYLSGFTIKNAGKSLSGAAIENSSPWIHDNVLTENEFGIYIKGESRPVIQKNVIKNSSKGIQAYNFIEEKADEPAAAESKEEGLPEKSLTKPIIIDNLITDNKIGVDLHNSHADIGHNNISYNNHYKTYLGATYGVNLSGSSSNISSNIITDNGICELCAGINADENSKNVTISYNDIWNNRNDFLCFGECVLEENNVSEDPLYADTMLGDYKLQADSTLIGKAKDESDIGIRW